MSASISIGHRAAGVVRDLVQLTKPRVTQMNVIMCLGGLGLAPGSAEMKVAAGALLGTALAVGSANTLNMYIERDGDRLMRRTARRPLPAGRLSPRAALFFGIVIGLLAIAVLSAWVNVLTAALGAFALLAYVLVYTPMKRVSPLALVIGAVPGAIPPLMGWTAVTNHIDPAAVALFGVLLTWQIPHFIAISFYHDADYAKAGIKTVPGVRGARNAKWQALVYSVALLAVSLAFVPLGVAGAIYGVAALALGVWFTAVCLEGFRSRTAATDVKWARRFFLVSLVYLPAWAGALLVDVVVSLLK